MKSVNRMQDIEYGDVFSLADAYEIPASVTIEVDTACNLKCKHCYIPNNINVGLPFHVIHDIFCQLRKLGTFEIVLTGGEIFCRADGINIIKLARQMGFDVVIFSNASLIDESTAKEISEQYVSMFSTSIYSMKESIHDNITGVNGSFKATIHGLELLKKYGVSVEVKTMIMKENYLSINDVYQYCLNQGFGYVASPFIFCQSDRDRTPLNFRISVSEMKEIIDVLDEIVGFEPRVRDENEYMCSSIQHSFGIDARGVVYPCNAMFYNVGNIYESTLKDIWYSDKLRAIRNLKYKDLWECKNCQKSSHCIRCAGIALGESNDMLSKFAFACEVASIRFDKDR